MPKGYLTQTARNRIASDYACHMLTKNLAQNTEGLLSEAEQEQVFRSFAEKAHNEIHQKAGAGFPFHANQMPAVFLEIGGLQFLCSGPDLMIDPKAGGIVV